MLQGTALYRAPSIVSLATHIDLLRYLAGNANYDTAFQNQIQHRLSTDILEASILVPFALVGTFVGASLTKRIDERLFFLIVQIGLFVVSCKLVAGVLISY